MEVIGSIGTEETFISVKQFIQQSDPSVCWMTMEREMVKAVHGALLGS